MTGRPSLVLALLLVGIGAGGAWTPGVAQAGEPRLDEVSIFVSLPGGMGYLPLQVWELARLVSAEERQFAPKARFKVKVKAKGGEWVGISFRDSRGKVYDVPAHERRLLRGYKEFEWQLPSNFANGGVEVTIVLWRAYDQSVDRMVGELDRIPWSRLGAYSF